MSKYDNGTVLGMKFMWTQLVPAFIFTIAALALWSFLNGNTISISKLLLGAVILMAVLSFWVVLDRVDRKN